MSNRVISLGSRFPVPVEIIPLAEPLLSRELGALGAVVELRRTSAGTTTITDEGNYILDCNFGQIADPEALADRLDRMVGVVEHGLFIGFAPTLVVGQSSAG